MTSQRVRLGPELLNTDGDRVLAALDSVRIVVRPGSQPVAALAAAGLVAQLRRVHAHVELDGDADLPPTCWDRSTLAALHTRLDGLSPEPAGPAERTLIVATGDATGAADVRVHADSWTAAVTAGDVHVPLLTSEAPYGGLAAASLAAAHVFRAALGPLGLLRGPRGDDVVWNLLDHRRRPAPDIAGHARRWEPLALLGTGSVGTSAVAALACDDVTRLEAVLIDPDTFDPDRNPYRYPACVGGETGYKAQWASALLRSMGASAEAATVPIATWVRAARRPGFDGIVVSSVDSVDGRYDAADVLARTTVSAAVDGLALHVQREHLGDSWQCPFCEYVDLRAPLSQAGTDAALFGLNELRILELTMTDSGGLTEADLAVVVAAGKLRQDSVPGLLGRRLADLRPRVYAEATITLEGTIAPVPVSAPFVSMFAGVVAAAEVAKAARGLPLVDRRVEVDLHGVPGDFVLRLPADRSGRCACANPTRRRWMRSMYPRLPSALV